MTLRVGQSVDVVAKAVRTYGIHCEYDGDANLLLLIPDISWIASFDSCEQFAVEGDALTVVIKHIDHSSGKIAASIRDRFVDPWEQGAFQPGKRYRARIVRFVQNADRCDYRPAYLVELLPGAYAMLCGSTDRLHSGDECEIIVTDSNRERLAVSIALADTTEHDRDLSFTR